MINELYLHLIHLHLSFYVLSIRIKAIRCGLDTPKTLSSLDLLLDDVLTPFCVQTQEQALAINPGDAAVPDTLSCMSGSIYVFFI